MKNRKEKNKSSSQSLEEISKISCLEVEKIESCDELLFFEKKYLKGKESYFSFLLSELGEMNDKERKRKIGEEINNWKNKLLESIKLKKERICFFDQNKKKLKRLNNVLDQNYLFTKDDKAIGSFHLIRKSLSGIYSFFISRGYKVFEGSEVDTKWYNFDSLNLKDDHPARSWSDTFYFSKDESLLLRTHTSNSQTKVMESNRNEEIMVVSGGKVYRNDDDDVTHSHQYTNIELVRVGKEVSFSNLKWTLEDFFRWFFEKELTTRFRPSFFPFTEPSFEVDVSCFSCSESKIEKCKVCKGTGWIEILGAGLINPLVLKNGGYNEKVFSGFAAGIGLERILMVKYGIDDIRDFYSNDPRFLIQTIWS